MPITLSLLKLRDILTNYDNSAALNAARAFEARQPYSHLDSVVPSRILDADTARLIAEQDPHENIFHIQIKRLPPAYIDQWTPTAEYAVVHAISDWHTCAEQKFQKSEAQRLANEFNAAVIAEVERKHRMVKKICSRIPIRESDVAAVFHQCSDEASLHEMVKHWEQALGTPIYEPPQEVSASAPEGDQGLQETQAPAVQETEATRSSAPESLS